ncbi:MAG: transcription termination factor Rho [Actinomycetota bacterium]
MSDQLIVERGGLEKKDKGELQAIVSALGGRASSRSKKADLIDQILQLSGAALPADGDEAVDDTAPTDAAADTTDADNGQGDAAEADGDDAGSDTADGDDADSSADHPVGPDGEPLADWEVEILEDGQPAGQGNRGNQGGKGRNQRGRGRGNNQQGGQQSRGGDGNQQGSQQGGGNGGDGGANQQGNGGEGDGDVDPNNRRSRRRGRGRGRDRDDAGNEPISTEPVAVSGSLDLRDEGYGFLRVNGYLPSKEDVYVSIKQVRQFGLRKGDHLTGLSRPANRNEKNPGFHQIDTVNGASPDAARHRPRFDDLTPLFPDSQLTMEMREEPLNMTSRIIDLIAPIGKGQRGLIVSPPKAGKTSVMKDIARAIETNNPEVKLQVLLLDERPEEVTDMQRHLSNGEVIASTFDRPPDEHVAVAELTIERAKRMVEQGEDVVLIVDGITRLARAYNMTAPQSGRAMSGGLDAAAIYPPKRFFGAARNLEEGGSLTILATALVETGSRMDEVIFEEFKGTGNMELRLDRQLAEKRIFPAIDVAGSATRREELLLDRKELQQSWKLRRVLTAMGDDGSSAAGVEMLVERLGTFKTNAEFLAEMAKAPSQ